MNTCFGRGWSLMVVHSSLCTSLYQTLKENNFLEARKAELLVHVLHSTQLEVNERRSAGR